MAWPTWEALTAMATDWYSVRSDLLRDDGFQSLSERDQRRFFMLLCLGPGRGGAPDDQEIAASLRISAAKWALTKARLMRTGMINGNNRVFYGKTPRVQPEATPDGGPSPKRTKAEEKAEAQAMRAEERARKAQALAEAEAKKAEARAARAAALEEALAKRAEARAMKAEMDDGCPKDEIARLYNAMVDIAMARGYSLRKMKKVRVPVFPILSQKIHARWAEDKERQEIGWWEQFFKNIGESDYLTGRVLKWCASLNWILGPENIEKILCGDYENGTDGGMTRRSMNNAKILEEWENEGY
jgi:hypothetical protein